MKKNFLFISVILVSVLLIGCGMKDNNNENTNDNASPSPIPSVTLPAGNNTENTATNAPVALTLKDYYPMLADTEYVYQGKGNEFAAYTRYTDFLDEENNRIQTRTNNGGTETVRVIEIKDGKLSVIRTVNECYYRDNLLEEDASEEEPEILLMEPLVKGTQWTLPDGRKRFISNTEVAVDTPTGSYKAIEVTTEETDSTTKDYYAPQAGLVKSIFGSGDSEISSTLSKMNSNTPFTQTIDIYYPDSDEKIYTEPMTLTFHTGDATRLVLQEALQSEVKKDSYLPLASINTKINSMYLGKDNIVYVDFSKELVSDMNAGAGYELLILQSITNTLGNYYGAQKVYITMEGKPYESGHILMKKGETFKVNMDKVVR
jgi:hypothetical protein